MTRPQQAPPCPGRLQASGEGSCPAEAGSLSDLLFAASSLGWKPKCSVPLPVVSLGEFLTGSRSGCLVAATQDHPPKLLPAWLVADHMVERAALTLIDSFSQTDDLYYLKNNNNQVTFWLLTKSSVCSLRNVHWLVAALQSWNSPLYEVMEHSPFVLGFHQRPSSSPAPGAPRGGVPAVCHH